MPQRSGATGIFGANAIAGTKILTSIFGASSNAGGFLIAGEGYCSMVFKKFMVSFFARDSGATNNNLVTPPIKSCLTLRVSVLFKEEFRT